MKYKVGDAVVHLSHGIGVIKAIEDRCFPGKEGSTKFYIMEIQDNGAPKKVFIPVESEAQRLRPIMSASNVKEVYKILAQQGEAIDSQTWSRRYREYMELIHSGEATAIARVLRALVQLHNDKDLSFGERKLLDQARQLLVKELSLAQNISEDEAEERIRACLGVSDTVRNAVLPIALTR